MHVDVHCHVGQRTRACQPDERFGFEPLGRYSPYDAYFSDRINSSIGMRVAKWYFGVPKTTSAKAADAAAEHKLLEHILGSRLVDRVVVLAFDQYHTSAGQALGPRRNRRQVGTDLYVSNTYVRHLWRQHPERILFGASIHPYRETDGMPATAMLPNSPQYARKLRCRGAGKPTDPRSNVKPSSTVCPIA